MAKMIHSMIRVRDEARSLAFYDLFGLSITERLDFESFSLIYLSNPESGFELELTVNKGDTAYDLGNGYGHLAFLEDDLETMHRRLVEAGHSPRDIKDFAPDGDTVARFFFVADPDGYEIEVLARKGRFAAQ
ncbi:VOC family protein [Limimaricola cinnabarinus]|uniref:Aldoketomutase n=1 Tax=Limimaricola cinnabarinus LL-001 TaxID=1337093 RepID=U2Z7C2_9RHOB|nr:VOC family protein [Limimaricola cinnabarinus]GAD56952.1 lactoylglutathione lyase [Limimaricola cinnabarinus LL-001]